MTGLGLFKMAFHEWTKDKATQMGAALAFYSVFSLAPLLMVAIAVAGGIFGEEAARGMLDQQLAEFMGESAAEAVQSILGNNHRSGANGWMAVVGMVTLLSSASAVFGQLKESMNTVWKVEEQPGGGIFKMVKDRFLSMTMVLGVGFLLLVSLVFSAVLAAAHDYLGRVLPVAPFIWQLFEWAIAFGVITVLFAFMFKVLPDKTIRWREVWPGAAITAFFFSVGKSLLGLYLGREGAFSAYGAAGALVLILLWVYYSSLILLFGAEFTRVQANWQRNRRK